MKEAVLDSAIVDIVPGAQESWLERLPGSRRL